MSNGVDASKLALPDFVRESQLPGCLAQVRAVFDAEELAAQVSDEEVAVDYYERAAWMYKLVYSWHGAMHMGLTFGRKWFKRRDLLGQARLVQELLDRDGATRVLEAGCGRGFNVAHLARQNPNVQFVGVDLTPSHLRIASRKAEALPNLQIVRGNFLRLPFAADFFDIVFEVEATCHATSVRTMFEEIHRVLRPGGHLCRFDGIRGNNFEALHPELRAAAVLAEQSFAVTADPTLDSVEHLIDEVGFGVVREDDLTDAIMPTLRNLQIMSKAFFFSPVIARLLVRLLSREAVQSTIAGLLAPLTMGLGAHRYQYQVLNKKPR